MKRPVAKFLARGLTLVKGMGAALEKDTPVPGRTPAKARVG